jgi:hypothetical protein
MAIKSATAGLAAIAKVLSSGLEIRDVEKLKILAVFCGLGLAVSLILASNGLDMSLGFF